MKKKSDYTGDEFGDWVVMSRAKPVGGKRMWNVVNRQTDETRIVPQTELKSLAAKPCPADENCSITEDGKHEMPSSREITTKVLIGNHKDDPFNLPDGLFPDDDSEFPFSAVFVEPENPFEGEGPEVDDCCDNYTCGACRDEDEPDELDIAKETTREMAIAFADSLVDAIADHLTSFIEEWRVIAKDELAASVQVNDLS